MKLSRISARVAALLLIAVVGAAHAEPRIKHVMLEKHTVLTLAMAPDLGTRFVFPFALDEQDEYVPFTLAITNPAFEQRREEGRNSFVVTIKPSKDRSPVISDLFLTVAGYEITVELRTTTDLTQHYTDIVFELGEGVRETLIQQGIRQRTKALEKDYETKLQGIEALAEQKALARVGALALSSPSSKSVKEDATLRMANGDKLTLSVDKIETYGPYALVVWELYNASRSQEIVVQDARLFAVDPKTKQEHAIDGANELPPRVTTRQTVRGVTTVLATQIPKDNYLKFAVNTDKGVVNAQW